MALEKKYLDQIYNLPSANGLTRNTAGSIPDKKFSNYSKKGSEADMANEHRQQLLANSMYKDASELEVALKKQQEEKDKEIENCRELYYIKLTMKIVGLLTIYGILVFLFPVVFFNFMPIFRSVVSFQDFLNRKNFMGGFG